MDSFDSLHAQVRNVTGLGHDDAFTVAEALDAEGRHVDGRADERAIVAVADELGLASATY